MQVEHTDRKIHAVCVFQYVSFSTSIKMVKEMQRLFDASKLVRNGDANRRKNENR